jgi:hypothetical protein
VIGLQVQRQLDDWAVGLLTAMGTPKRRDAAFKAVAKVVHPDVATGDETLMRDLLEARHQVEERQADMSGSAPLVEYASMSSGDMFMQAVAEIADAKVRQLAAQTGLPVSHVRQLKRENRLHELYDSDGRVMAKAEFRGRISGREAQRQLERMRYPRLSVEERRAILDAMQAKRTRSGAEARQLTEAAYRPGHVWFIPTLK